MTFALILISWASIKIVLPAIPGLANIFNSTPGGVKLSVSLYLIFYACSQPVWGGVVQKTSCRQTLFYSLFITITGSLISMFSYNLPMYIIGRTLEGVGMGAASPIGRTLFADVFERKELARRIGIISGFAAAMPAVTPIIGGYLMMWINWRAIFGFLLLLSVVFFYFAFRRLPVTRIKSADEGTLTIRKLLGTYFFILGNTHFWGYTLAYATATGGLLGYYSAMPFWFHSQLGIAEHIFSYLAIPTVCMYIIGLVSARFLI
ncbi:MAG: MFS transporter, partial [Bacteroidetes bacterium]|nr:MFS transporter [Bacteroidota bacterium]